MLGKGSPTELRTQTLRYWRDSVNSNKTGSFLSATQPENQHEKKDICIVGDQIQPFLYREGSWKAQDQVCFPPILAPVHAEIYTTECIMGSA